ncbi:MAG: WYL domain-containing protein, partial [Lachnospiraceae bacterium]
YHGEKTKVCIKFANHMCGVFIDRFGKDTIFRKTDENHSEMIVDINVSPQFFGWIFSLGNDVEIVSPKEVVNELREYTKKFMLKYELIRGEL